MNEETMISIAQDAKKHYEKLKESGDSQEDIRKFMVDSANATAQYVFDHGHAIKVLTSPIYAFNFVYRYNQILGGINAVMIDAEIDPIHITEVTFLNELLIETMEEVAGKKIDEILAEMETTEQKMIENNEPFMTYEESMNLDNEEEE